MTADEVPVTRRMLVEVRNELLSRIDQTKEELKQTREELKADISGVKADISGLKADVARIHFLIEEQNARNKVALDALTAFIDRQQRVEDRVDAVEGVVRDLARSRPV